MKRRKMYWGFPIATLFMQISALLCWLSVSEFALGQASATGNATRAEVAAEQAQKPSTRSSSGVEYFRELLAMAPLDRERALANQPPGVRQSIETKIKEFADLSSEEKEERMARLRLAEIRLYLVPLMRLPSDQRPAKLAQIPAADRELIEERLKQWDSLPAPSQKEFLENEATVQYFVRLESSTPEQRGQILSQFPDEARKSLEAKLQQWLAQPDDDRQRMYRQFNQFFDLPAEDKQRTLKALSDPERQEMQEALRAFENLPTTQREALIQSFRKFAHMTKAERDQFLKNAERWKEMTPRERETWRNLVNLLPQPTAPLPPGAGRTPPGGTNIPTKQPRLPGK